MRGDPCIKPFFLLAMASETAISFNHLAAIKLRKTVTRTIPISASMWFIVFLAALACGVCCNENLPSQLLSQPKYKRGVSDRSVTFPSSSSYSAPVHSSLSSGYALGGSSGSGGFTLGHAGLLNSGGSAGHGYSLSPSSGLSLGAGYQSPGSSHGYLSQQSVSLGGHSAQSTYSVPSIANLGSGGRGSGALYTPSKTGPVTFGLHGGGGASTSSGSGSSSSSYSSPIYSSGGHGLSAYSNGGTSNNNVGAQISVLGSSQRGLSSDISSSYNLPVHSASSSPSHTVTGGLLIASPSHGSSSSYSLPTSASSHGISALGSTWGIHGGSSTYSLPTSPGSHGISALSSSAGSSGHLASSGSYGSNSIHSGFSDISSGDSSYKLPIASGSYTNSGSSNAISHINYVPSHSSGSSSSYSSPSVSYAVPSINHVASPGSGYSGGNAYSFSSNYVGSGSSPIVAYTRSHGYTPTYYSSSGYHATPADSHGAHTDVSPRYLGHVPGAKFHNVDSDSAKYDTISYSVPNGKY